jgi:hypothetical protein
MTPIWSLSWKRPVLLAMLKVRSVDAHKEREKAQAREKSELVEE